MFNGRLEVWWIAWEYFHAEPLWRQMIGNGWGSATVMSGGQLFTTLHNDWLQILFTTGWLGLWAFALFYTALYHFACRRNQCVLAGFAVAMCGNPVLHFLPTLLVLLTVIGETFYAQIQERRKARDLGENNGVHRIKFGGAL